MTEYRFAAAEDYKNLIEMANHAFDPKHWTGDFEKDTSPESFFPRILPKLYQNIKTAPMHYIAVQDGKVVGVVGNFELPTMVAGEKLYVIGIGTVSTHPDHRGEGHMIRLMDDSVARAKSFGADYMVLGGDRQRYEHWGFETAGLNPEFVFDEHAFRHLYGKDADFGYRFVPFSEELKEELALAKKLRTSEQTYVLHEPDQEYNIYFSMGAKPYFIMKDGTCTGSLMSFDGGKTIGDLRTVNPSEIGKILNDYRKIFEVSELRVSRVAPDEEEMLAILSRISGESTISGCEMIRVLNYERTIRAFLRMKCVVNAVPDCEISAAFDNGERLRIGVQDGEAFVEKLPETAPADVSFKRPEEAVNYFFGHMRFITDFGLGELPQAPFLPLPYYQPACDEI